MIVPLRKNFKVYGVFDRKTGERMEMRSGISFWNNEASVHKAIGFHLRDVTVRSWSRYTYGWKTSMELRTKEEYFEKYPITPETTYKIFIIQQEKYYAFVHHGELTEFETEKQLRKFIHEEVFEVREVA